MNLPDAFGCVIAVSSMMISERLKLLSGYVARLSRADSFQHAKRTLRTQLMSSPVLAKRARVHKPTASISGTRCDVACP